LFCRPALHALNGLKSLSDTFRQRNLEKAAVETPRNQVLLRRPEAVAGRLKTAGTSREAFSFGHGFARIAEK